MYPCIISLSHCGVLKNGFSELARLPLFAPNSLVGIWANLWDNFPEEFLDGIPESRWKPVDLALCDPKFPHLKSAEFSDSSERPVKNPHAFFERVLPKSYERGILWLNATVEKVCISYVRLCFLLLTCIGQPTRITPVDPPQYPGLPLEWDDFVLQ